MTKHTCSVEEFLLQVYKREVQDYRILARKGVIITGPGTIQVRHTAKKKALGLSHAEIVSIVDDVKHKIPAFVRDHFGKDVKL